MFEDSRRHPPAGLVQYPRRIPNRHGTAVSLRGYVRFHQGTAEAGRGCQSPPFEPRFNWIFQLSRFLFRQIVQTIHECSQKKVLHRDLKVGINANGEFLTHIE